MSEFGVVVELAGTPVGKGRPRFSSKSMAAFTPAKTRAYEAALKFAAQEAMQGRAPIEGPLSVLVVASFPIPKSWPKKKRVAATVGAVHHTSRPDVDNLMKCLDSLNEVVWHDDAQITRCIVSKLYDDRPSLVIKVVPV